MIGAAPQCVRCRHLFDRKGPLACRAFPKGIPDAILEGEHDHREAYARDKGVRFEGKAGQ